MDRGRRIAAWPVAPVIDWLLRDGRLQTDAVSLLERLAARLLQAGAPLWRVRLGFFTIHPQLAAWAHIWTRGQPARIERIPYGVQRTGAYIGSPAQKMVDSGSAVRYRLDHLQASDHPVLHELAAAGGRDYLLLPLRFSDRSLNVLALATDDEGGFSEHDVESFERLSHPLAAVLEVAATHRAAETLLDTYVGHRTGRRILQGQIHRGDAEEIDAAIWYADLRGFTPLTETLPAARLLDLLNSYFELVAAAVTPRGGEILRFMGDAMLILFPADRRGELGPACRAALESALEAFERAEQVNRGRRLEGCPEIRFGVGLNAGKVVYGNIGAPDRLDFTVIGPAVNRAARLETLTKDLGVPLLMTGTFAAALGRPARSLGLQRMRGLEEPVEVFALAL
jgi:adenylate cyclase